MLRKKACVDSTIMPREISYLTTMRYLNSQGTRVAGSMVHHQHEQGMNGGGAIL